MSERIQNWLERNIISLVLAIVTLSSAIYTAASSHSAQLTKLQIICKQNEMRVQEISIKLEKTVDILNQHLIVSEGRSTTLRELEEKIKHIEKPPRQ